MRNSEIIAIACLGKRTRYIALGDDLLWRISEDLVRVKSLTMGHPLIMGRKTYESIGRPLPGRTNIILTRNTDFRAEGCTVVHTVEEALAAAHDAEGGERIFIFGGAEIYRLFLDQTDTLMLTVVDSAKEGTATFPPYADEFVERERHGGGEFEGESYEWIDCERQR